MSETTTKRALEQDVERINKRFGAGLALEWAYGRPRVTNASQSRDISPRLPKRELSIWLDGYYQALDRAQDLDLIRTRGSRLPTCKEWRENMTEAESARD